MITEKINDLPKFEKVAVIINVKTHVSSTLALLSVHKKVKCPIVLFDCSEDDFESHYFELLQKEFNFFIIKLPLRIHGLTLDYIFKNINAKYILLMDSDAEIKKSEYFENDLFYHQNSFGLGFINGPCWLSEISAGAGGKFVFYQERMFMPCVLLKREMVLDALNAECSFAAKEILNDTPIRLINRVIKKRFKIDYFKEHDIKILNLLRKTYYDYNKPSRIIYDTGAEIYLYLKYRLFRNFIGVPETFHTRYFNHYFGLTRKTLNNQDKNIGNHNNINIRICSILEREYNFDIKKLDKTNSII